MTTYYGVKTVADDALAGQEFAFVNLTNGGILLLIIRSATGRTIAEAWTAARAMQSKAPSLSPSERRLALVR